MTLKFPIRAGLTALAAIGAFLVLADSGFAQDAAAGTGPAAAAEPTVPKSQR